MAKSRSRSVIKGAFILTLAGLLSKIISAGYRIPLQNLTGDLGFYIYQQVYPILGIALILSLYGFPAAISKLVSELNEDKVPLSIPSFYLPVLTWLMGICGVIFLMGYTQAPRLASLMGDDRLAPSLQAAFFVFLLVPFVSILRGVFQGRNEMGPTAVSQIMEQVLRVAVIIMTAFLVMKGKEVYSIGIGASLGSIIGACGAVLLLLAWVKKERQIWTFNRWDSRRSYIKTIFLHGLFICFNYMLLLSLQLVDALTLVPGLVAAGMDVGAGRLAKGVFDRGQPLIQLGTVLASSLALALIPSVTRKRKKQNPEEVDRAIVTAVKFTVIIALGATVGLVFLFPDINQLFFQDSKGSNALRLLMTVILGSSISITTSSVLQGLGYVKQTALTVLGGLVIKVIGNLLLIPWLGMYGAATASIIAVTFVLMGNIVTLRQEVRFHTWLTLPWASIALSLMGMAIGLYSLHAFIHLFAMTGNRMVLLLCTLILTGIGGCLYLILLLKLGSFSKSEVQSLPSYKWLLRFLPKGMK